MKIADYEDVAIEQGWKEWRAEGVRYKAESKGSGRWKIYTQEPDCFVGDAYIYRATVWTKKYKATTQLLTQLFLECDD